MVNMKNRKQVPTSDTSQLDDTTSWSAWLNTHCCGRRRPTTVTTQQLVFYQADHSPSATSSNYFIICINSFSKINSCVFLPNMHFSSSISTLYQSTESLSSAYCDAQGKMVPNSEVIRRHDLFMKFKGLFRDSHPLDSVIHDCLACLAERRPKAEDVTARLEPELQRRWLSEDFLEAIRKGPLLVNVYVLQLYLYTV